MLLPLLSVTPSIADQVTFKWDASTGHYNKCDCSPACDPCEPCPSPDITSYSLWSAPPGTTDFNKEHKVGNVTQATIDIPDGTPVAAKAVDGAGHISGFSNTVIYRASGLAPATNLEVVENCTNDKIEYFEDFSSYQDGQDPDGWTDTAANNSMSGRDYFEVRNNVLVSKGSGVNYHSHYSEDFQIGAGLTFTGKMLKASSSSAGMGLTFASDYQNRDIYYRLRSYNNYRWELSPHPYRSGAGRTLGVTCEVNVWYRFKVQVIDTGSETQISAKMWKDGQSEPAAWQVQVTDSTTSRRTHGKIGVWAMGTVAHKWDDFKVERN